MISTVNGITDFILYDPDSGIDHLDPHNQHTRVFSLYDDQIRAVVIQIFCARVSLRILTRDPRPRPPSQTCNIESAGAGHAHNDWCRNV